MPQPTTQMRGGEGDECAGGERVQLARSSSTLPQSARRFVRQAWSLRMQFNKSGDRAPSPCEASAIEQPRDPTVSIDNPPRPGYTHARIRGEPSRPLPQPLTTRWRTPGTDVLADAFSTCTTPSLSGAPATPSTPASSDPSMRSSRWSWSRVLNPTRSRRYRRGVESPGTDDTASMHSTAYAYFTSTLRTGTTETTIRSPSNVPETCGFPFPDTSSPRSPYTPSSNWANPVSSSPPSAPRARPTLKKTAAFYPPCDLPPNPDASPPHDPLGSLVRQWPSAPALPDVAGDSDQVGVGGEASLKLDNPSVAATGSAEQPTSQNEQLSWDLLPPLSTRTGSREGRHASAGSVEWPPPSLSSRFSDWTPTPSARSRASSSACSLVDGSDGERPSEDSVSGDFAASVAPPALATGVHLDPSSIVDEGQVGRPGMGETAREQLEQTRRIATRFLDGVELLCIGGRKGCETVAELDGSRRFSTGGGPLRRIGVAG